MIQRKTSSFGTFVLLGLLTLIGCDRTAYGSVRVMGTSFATGQAAGVSAALAAEGKIDYASIARALKDQDAII